MHAKVRQDREHRDPGSVAEQAAPLGDMRGVRLDEHHLAHKQRRAPRLVVVFKQAGGAMLDCRPGLVTAKPFCGPGWCSGDRRRR